MNYDGVILAAASLAVIAIFHPLVIKAEYYFSARVWPVFALAGALCLTVSLFLKGVASPLLAFVGVTNLWCVFEVHAQARRVEKGWFPKNPRR